MLAQLIQFASLLVLARLYIDAEFSDLAIMQSIATILSAVICLQLHHCIPLERYSSTQKELYTLVSLIIFLLFMFILTAAIFIANELLIFGVVMAFLLANYNLNVLLLVKMESFSFLSKIYVFRALAIVTLQYIFSYSDNEYRIIYACLLAELITLGLFSPLFRNYTLKTGKVILTVKNIFSKEKSFYMYGVVHECCSILMFFSPLFIFKFIYGDNFSGNYAMASRLVWAPTILITSSVSYVFYSKIAKLTDAEVIEYYKPFLRLKNLSLGAIFFTIVGLVSFQCTDLFSFVLGDGWSKAVFMMPWLIIWGASFIMVSLFRVGYRRLGKLKMLFFIELPFQCIIFFPLVFDISGDVAFLVFSVSSTISNFVIMSVYIFGTYKNESFLLPK
ncbi:hypothetical protein KIJ96_05940 [Pseudoalteromonas piscicida]|uniref:hypothetical protein n=1 Tax=Pseudoalteromonas piscicida TaxID=43662 RepID=UPI001D0B9DBC|nr:hypothetical protein [Pseudoalteromonas piscicida]UDM62780.1 hypothetical protein KIJ96_05940 [Pseudoalteromonas piscicida]